MPRLILLSLFVCLAYAQTAESPFPNPEMRNPEGQKIQFRFHTLPNSVQIYTCKPVEQSFAWSGPDPDAILVDAAHKLTVHHYKGPTWEATDGSIVHSEGPLAVHFLPNQPGAVHWLELPAKGGSKQFAKVTMIHRVDTAGGVAPTDRPCDAQHAGEQVRVDYSATYLFYAPPK